MNTTQILVRPMVSPRTNAPVTNQYTIKTEEGVYFQSYESVIAHRDENGVITLDSYYWDYSRTTLKYLAQFLRYQTGASINGKRDIEKLIQGGHYQLANLN